MCNYIFNFKNFKNSSFFWLQLILNNNFYNIFKSILLYNFELFK